MVSKSLPTIQDVQRQARDFGKSRADYRPLVIPRSAVPFTAIGAAPCPLLGAANQIVVVEYKVLPLWFAYVWGVILFYSGNPDLVPGSGDGIWTVDTDLPLLATTGGYTEKDYEAVTVPRGSPTHGPFPVDFRHWAGETLRVKFTALANLTPGAPNYVVGGLIGHTWRPEGGQGWEG